MAEKKSRTPPYWIAVLNAGSNSAVFKKFKIFKE